MNESAGSGGRIPPLVVLTNGNIFARIILEALFRKYPESIRGVIIVTGDYKGQTGLSAGWSLLRSMTLPYFLYKALTVVGFSVAQRLSPQKVLTVEGLCRVHHLPSWRVMSVNSVQARELARACKPDLLLSVSCPQRIKNSMLELAPQGGINVHCSLLPAFAGLAPYFWVLSKGETQTGVTVHRMTSKFDAGEVFWQERIQITQRESAFCLFTKLSQVASVALLKSVEAISAGSTSLPQSNENSSYYSHPSFRSYLQLRRHGHCLVRFREFWEALCGNFGSGGCEP